MMTGSIETRYKIIKSIGSGGFGDTFLAQDLQMPSGRQVVIKKLKPLHQNNISIELIQGLFEREAKVLEELGQNCSQIPTLYAYFTEDEEFYLVQEYIEGKSLAELGAISSAQCESILSSLLNTLKYIHSKNIIHRDIKPENIIIRESDKLPVLIDFGAVKESMGAVSLSSGGAVSSVIVGTRGFIPPEQSTGRTVFSSDLYALSLTMIYSLTGKYPIEIPNNNITGELDWQSYVPNLPSNLRLVLEKASKIDLNQRYPTSQAMYEALHMSQINTVAVIPPVNNIDLSKPINSNSSPTVLIPNSSINNNPNSVSYPVSGINQNPISNPQNNNILVIIITALLVALAVSAGFLITQHMKETQEKLATVEKQKKETETKLAEELKRQELEKKTLQDTQSTQNLNTSNNVIDTSQNDSINNDTQSISVADAVETIETLYYFLSEKEFDQAIQLYSYQLSSTFNSNFFQQFARITVEDLQSTYQTPTSINLIGYNTYVYYDGSTQREKRSYSVGIIDGKPKITSSEFIKVTKSR